jgi:hypothetical protein
MNRLNIGQWQQLVDLAAMNNALNANGNGAAVDLVDKEGEMVISFTAKNVSGTTPTLDGKLQDSDDGVSGFADVAGIAVAQVTAGPSSQKLTFKKSQCKRFVRWVDTVGGTTPVYARSVQLFAIKKTPA